MNGMLHCYECQKTQSEGEKFYIHPNLMFCHLCAKCHGHIYKRKDRHMNKELIYLAVPYTHPDPNVKHERFSIANRVAAKLMQLGLYIFSPISHTHPIALAGDLPGNWEFWENFDRLYLAVSKQIIVVAIPGWRESVGVQNEIRID